MKRATIKDIARKCSISPTVASAALRGKTGGTVAYSEETRRNVLQAAKELGYRPNRLAQAMKSGIIPVVAVSLRIDGQIKDAINFYLHDILPMAALRLHELGFEMLFLPYYEHEDQIKRLNELLDDRLIGGIISNFIQGEEKKLVDFYKQTEVPLVVLGNIENSILPCVSVSKKDLNENIIDFAKAKSFKDVYFTDLESSGKFTFKRLIDGKNFIATPKDNLKRQNSLFVVYGEKQRNRLLMEENLQEDQMLLIEDFRMPVQSKPALLVKSKTGERAILSAELIADWMKSGAPPTIKQYVIETNSEEYQIKTS